MKVSRNQKLAALGTGIVATAAIIAGCTSPQYDDLQNVNPSYPNYVALYINLDGHPNIAKVCIDGVAFATTTRDYNAILRIPEWDAFCRAQIGKQATVNGQP